ncbi:hypothetical protein CL614_02205 [archaeon]|nr:hypothetical protein [archaeon]|tara:strand:+ start:2236 stop:2496 length:261 start_codon:yes stop_codon:yes gene_type:complete
MNGYVESPLEHAQTDEKYAAIQDHCRAQRCKPSPTGCKGFHCPQIGERVKRFGQISHVPDHSIKSAPRPTYRSTEHRRPRKHFPES